MNFPGMDPYLEDPRVWHSFHQQAIVYLAEILQPHLRPRYSAAVEMRVFVERPGEPDRFPDVGVRTRTRPVPGAHPAVEREVSQPHKVRVAAAEVRGHDGQLALELEAARLGALLLNPDLPAKFEDEAERFADLPASTGAECLLRSFVARGALDTGPIAVAGDLAEQLRERRCWSFDRPPGGWRRLLCGHEA